MRMAVSREFAEYCAEQLGAAGRVTQKRMFGGVGFYLDDVFCALIGDSGRLFLKTDDSNRPDFEKHGCEPFKPFEDRDVVMTYYEVPEHVLDDSDELRDWARKARAVALAGQKQKRPRKSARKRKAGK